MPDDTSTRLAGNLRRLREQRQLTQQQLAERSGVPRPTLAHLESGEANPTLSVLVRVAEALHSSIEDLIAGSVPRATLHEARSLARRRREGAWVSDLCPDGGLSFERLELTRGAQGRAPGGVRGTSSYLTCEAGQLEVELGDARYHVARGDLLVVRGEAGYVYRNSGRASAVAFAVRAAAANFAVPES